MSSDSESKGADQAPPFNWHDYLKVHQAAELFPLMRETDPVGFAALVEDIKQNGLRTKVVTYSACDADGRVLDVPHLLDGRNRLDALALLGLLYETPDHHLGLKNWTSKGWSDRGSRIEAEYLWGENRDPYTLALSFNVHRRHLTGSQKRDLIAKVLKAKPEISDRTIGKQAKVDGKTVAAVRADLEERAEIPHVETRKDTKGRKQPAKRSGVRHKCWQCGGRAPVGEVKQHNYAAYEDVDIWLHDSCVAAFETQIERDKAECIALFQKATAAEQELAEHKAATSGEAMRAVEEEHKTNPLITAYQNASEKERFEFAEYVGGLRGQAKLAKAVRAAVVDPRRNLDPVKIGGFFELIGPNCFVESVRNAPKLWAKVERLLAEKTLATTEFSQTALLKANGSGGGAVY